MATSGMDDKERRAFDAKLSPPALDPIDLEQERLDRIRMIEAAGGEVVGA